MNLEPETVEITQVEKSERKPRTPSDPVAAVLAIVQRMNPDQLDMLGKTLAKAVPRSAAILSEAMNTSTRGPV